MPTGYTADIAKGITFEQYALDCARAFGALIKMRDDPKGAEIPEEFPPSSYHKDAIEEETKQLEELLTLDEVAATQRALAEYEENIKYHENAIAEGLELETKYRLMLASVDNYTPPTPDHVRFKEFMQEQIVSSIEADCMNDYHKKAIESTELMGGKVWLEVKMEHLRCSIERHKAEYQKELDRTESRNAWVRELRNSLKKP